MAPASTGGVHPLRSESRPDRPLTSQELMKAMVDAARGGPRTEDPILARPDIAALPPYRPKPSYHEVAADLGLDLDALLQLSANENPLGASPVALRRAQESLSTLHRFPDSHAGELRRALARRFAVGADWIALGNGSNELIELLVRSFVGSGQTVVGAWPSYVLYRLVTLAAGRQMLLAPLRQDHYDLGALAALVDQRTKIVFLANPNNPTGTYIPRRQLSAFLSRIPKEVIVVLDEAYYGYVDAADFPDGLSFVRSRPRLVVLRTFSKIYGLAGLRIGFGIMSPDMVQTIDTVRHLYNVNAVAQAAALGALEDESHLLASRKAARVGVKQLTEGLHALGLRVVPSQTNFVMVHFPVPAQPIVERLRLCGVLVRDLSGYQLPKAIRLSCGTPEENARLLGRMATLAPMWAGS